MPEIVERSKLRDVVAKRLKACIAGENLEPGDRLPTEAELAARFGASRLSLRDATKSLGFLGIVQSKPGRRLTVGCVNMDRATEYLGLHPALQDISPRELIDTRGIIESGVPPHTARRMEGDRSLYVALDAVNGGLRQARGSQRRIRLDISYHRGPIAASGLSPLLALGDLLAVFFRRFRESVKRAEWARGVASHQRIIDALKAGRLRAADREVRAHIESHYGCPEASK